MPMVSVPAACAPWAPSSSAAPSPSAIRCNNPGTLIPLTCFSLSSAPRRRAEAWPPVCLCRPLRCDADPGQILEPALCLHEPLHLGRHRPRIEVVHDKDHDRLAPLELVQLAEQRQPLLAVELVEDAADQILAFGAFEMAPIRARRSPIGAADQLDDRVDRIEQTA